MSIPRLFRTGALTGALFVCVPLALGQNHSDDYFKAYYLQHESGQLEEALNHYKRALKQLPKNHELRDKAQTAIQAIQEDLFCADLTRLMPPESIVYAELGEPGQQLRKLTGALGLLNVGNTPETMGISSKLFDSTLNLRGAAIAITEFDPNGGAPNHVVVLHPGNQDSVRGLIESAVGMGALPTEPIAGAATWSIEEEVFITSTNRLWIASPSRDEIQGVVRRLNGDDKHSFADVKSLKSQREANPDNLVFFHVRAEPLMPHIQAWAQQEAQNDPETAMAMDFIDIDSLVGITGQLGMDDEGLGLKVTLELAEDHRNLAFNLMRLPALKPTTLEHIPSGAAFVLAAALNEKANVAPASGAKDQPIVTALDFGREVFGNVVDICVFGLPGDKVNPLPEVALSLRVNDAQRSRALWNFVLGLATQSSGAGDMEPTIETLLGQEVERYSISGAPVYLMMSDGELLISPSKGLMERTIQARKDGRTALKDPLLANHIRALGDGTNLALLASPARLVKMGRFYIPSRERDQVNAVTSTMQDTVVRLGFRQTSSELGLDLKIANLPDVQPILALARAQEMGGAYADPEVATLLGEMGSKRSAEEKAALKRARSARAAAKRAERKAGAAAKKASNTYATVMNKSADNHAPSNAELRRAFEESIPKGDHEASLLTLRAYGTAIMDDASELNECAWALLTEAHYKGQFKSAALKLSERCHEISGGTNWMYLDTYALAQYQMGNLPQAVELGEKAYKLAANSGRSGEVLENLRIFRTALAEASTQKVGLR